MKETKCTYDSSVGTFFILRLNYYKREEGK